MDDEVALLSSEFRAAGDRFHLIGHSFGGAIALKAALANQDRVLSLVLYEPVLCTDAPPGWNQVEGVGLAIARLVTAVLSRVRIEEIEGVGHMAPVTHPETVNPLIERFLEATQLPLAGEVPKAKAHLKRNVRQPSAEAPMLPQGDLVADVTAGDLS